MPTLASPWVPSTRAASGWFFRWPPHFWSVTSECHCRGGAKQLYGVGPPSREGQPTVTPPASDAPETSPFRRSGHSKLASSTPRDRDPNRALAGESRPPASVVSRPMSRRLRFAPARPAGRFGGRLQSLRDVNRSPAAGPIQSNGVRAFAAPRPTMGSSPPCKPRLRGRPLVPQFG